MDERLGDPEPVRETLQNRSLTPFGDEEYVERLHRVFPPVFAVTHRYETDKRQWFGTVTTYLDGL